ncbi:hypothetical protein COCNU_01G004100 [Cocos nucifera]|uniref:Uncharacterized protein n=1 Tax=Cocos nucifera TaxID=13894 RepID=A0A8K0HTT6_COCNU|nr:hypothetical protein COCNU_01G004100 [Cocos nucifera]
MRYDRSRDSGIRVYQRVEGEQSEAREPKPQWRFPGVPPQNPFSRLFLSESEDEEETALPLPESSGRRLCSSSGRPWSTTSRAPPSGWSGRGSSLSNHDQLLVHLANQMATSNANGVEVQVSSSSATTCCAKCLQEIPLVLYVLGRVLLAVLIAKALASVPNGWENLCHPSNNSRMATWRIC